MANRIRLGLIGAAVQGTWSARAHLPALKASEAIELAAVCTTKAESAEAARAAFGARLAFDDYRQMIASPEIDAVSVVLRVPSHYVPAKAALEAGKHVFCEWPLGRTTAEAEELAALAKASGLVTTVGLQARVEPVLMHMKELIAGGYVGEVMAVQISLSRDGVLSRSTRRMWQGDASLGANTLTIANGHTIDALRFVLGDDFAELSARVATQATQWFDTDTKMWMDVTAPDQVLVHGRLNNGAVASLHVSVVPFAGAGYRMEIYGRAGTLVARGEDLPQMTELSLLGAQGNNTLAPISVPKSFYFAPAGTPGGEPYNVGQLYARFAQAIAGGPALQPDFDAAVGLHHLIDAIARSSESGKVVRHG